MSLKDVDFIPIIPYNRDTVKLDSEILQKREHMSFPDSWGDGTACERLLEK